MGWMGWILGYGWVRGRVVEEMQDSLRERPLLHPSAPPPAVVLCFSRTGVIMDGEKSYKL